VRKEWLLTTERKKWTLRFDKAASVVREEARPWKKEDNELSSKGGLPVVFTEKRFSGDPSTQKGRSPEGFEVLDEEKKAKVKDKSWKQKARGRFGYPQRRTAGRQKRETTPTYTSREGEGGGRGQDKNRGAIRLFDEGKLVSGKRRLWGGIWSWENYAVLLDDGPRLGGARC